MAGRAVIVAARRTLVAPRGGALKHLQADELAAPVLSKVLEDGKLAPEDVGQVLLGNALYGGGNPARLAALRAGIPQTVPAMTIDTQCCSGLDAIIMGARMIESGSAACVLAGGAESFSRAPIRMHRPVHKGGQPEPYDRPAFAPPPFEDPDLAEAAADLAARERISRQAQADFAVLSHKKALAAADWISCRLLDPTEKGLRSDTFTRKLSPKTALKAPVLAGTEHYGLNAATIACEADAAAAVLMVSEARARELGVGGLRIVHAKNGGGEPADPALVPISIGRELLESWKTTSDELAVFEIHEAYAVQAMMTASRLDANPEILNTMGGGLARGHPIGASGAILMVQVFESLTPNCKESRGTLRKGLALIAAAGGLAAGIAVEAVDYGSVT
ncbi:MAG: thiolase family protein [Roseibium sp.]